MAGLWLGLLCSPRLRRLTPSSGKSPQESSASPQPQAGSSSHPVSWALSSLVWRGFCVSCLLRQKGQRVRSGCQGMPGKGSPLRPHGLALAHEASPAPRSLEVEALSQSHVPSPESTKRKGKVGRGVLTPPWFTWGSHLELEGLRTKPVQNTGRGGLGCSPAGARPWVQFPASRTNRTRAGQAYPRTVWFLRKVPF